MSLKKKFGKCKFAKGNLEYRIFFAMVLFIGSITVLLIFASKDNINLQNPITSEFSNNTLEGGSSFNTSGTVSTLSNVKALFSFNSPFFWLTGSILLAFVVFGVIWVLNYIRGR